VRTVRTTSGVTTVRPRRTRCASCSKTHVLLPDKLLLRRVDEVDVIGSALLRSSLGDRYNKIATAISRPLTRLSQFLPEFMSILWISRGVKVLSTGVL